MEPDDGELLEAEGKSPSRGSLVLALRRIIYRCELLASTEFSDGNRQALWESVVLSYDRCLTTGKLGAVVDGLGAAHISTHELLTRERTRHIIAAATVIPDSICELDLQSGPLAEPYVDPAAARALAAALIAELARSG